MIRCIILVSTSGIEILNCKKKRMNLNHRQGWTLYWTYYLDIICSCTNILHDILDSIIWHTLPIFELKLHLFRTGITYYCKTKINVFNASSSVLPCMSKKKLITHIFFMGRLLIFPKDTGNQIFHLHESSWTPVFSITTQFLIFIFAVHLLLLKKLRTHQYEELSIPSLYLLNLKPL